MNSSVTWNIIDKYFENDKYNLVSHLLDSYNDFYEFGLKNIFKEKNPIKILKIKIRKLKSLIIVVKCILAAKKVTKYIMENL